MIQRIAGMADSIDLSKSQALINHIRTRLTTASFTEVKTPLIESCELFQRTLGTHTDVVGKEMYLVTTAHATNAPELCLRPEGTASIMRAYLQLTPVPQQPWRVFMIGPFFRHERPQKGRYRQFEQATIELIGGASPLHEVQLITLLDTFFRETLRLSNYTLALNYMGCPEDRTQFKEVLTPFLREHWATICTTCHTRTTHNPLRVFDCKAPACKQVYQQAPTIVQSLCTPCSSEWYTITTALEACGVSFYHVPQLVRGLDYYGKTVFEFISAQLGAQSTFCAGGRYDQLARELGSSADIPAVGGAIGIERLLLILESEGTIPGYHSVPAPIAVVPVTAQESELALHIVQMLTGAGIRAQGFFEDQPLKKKLKAAHVSGARHTVLIGPEEQRAGTVKVKNMETGEEQQLPQSALLNSIRIP